MPEDTQTHRRADPDGRHSAGPESPLPAWATAAGRDPTTGKLRPRRCGYYHPGHQVHWIQAKQGAADPRTCERGRLIGIEGDDLLVVRLIGTTTVRCYHTHEAPAVLDSIGRLGREVGVQQRWALLYAGRPFSICRYGNDWRPCPEPPSDEPTGPISADALARLVRERGGVSVPTAALDFVPSTPGGLQGRSESPLDPRRLRSS